MAVNTTELRRLAEERIAAGYPLPLFIAPEWMLSLLDRISYLESARATLLERDGALTGEAARLREALSQAAEALEDYGQHTARCSWDRRMDAESVCDCGLEEAQRAARAALAAADR